MFQYPRLLPYKVAHPRDKRLVAHNGGAVYLLSNVPRKPAASRSPRIRPVLMCTCAGPVVFQLLIFTASTNKPGAMKKPPALIALQNLWKRDQPTFTLTTMDAEKRDFCSDPLEIDMELFVGIIW